MTTSKPWAEDTAAVPDTSIAIPESTYTQELDDYDTGDLPMLSLLSSQSEVVAAEGSSAKAGQYYLDTEGILGEEVIFVPMGRYVTRKLEEGDYDAGTLRTVCESPDGVTGFGEPGGDCGTCPARLWTKNAESGKRIPPACGEAYNYLVYLPEVDEVAGFRLQSTGLTAGKWLHRQVKSLARKRTVEGNGYGVFSVRFTPNPEVPRVAQRPTGALLPDNR